MTVCVACLADDGKKVIAGTDTMMTYPIGTGGSYQIQNNSHDKLQLVTKDVAIMSSGSPDVIKVILDGAKNSIAEKDRPMDIAEKIRKSFEKYLKEKQEREILVPAGLNWDTYLKHQNQLQAIVVKDIHDKLQAQQTGCEIVLAGYDRTSSSCYISVISAPGATIYDRNSLGIALSGNGFTITNLFLAKSGYNKSMDETAVQKLVKDAIEEAGHAPGVGGIGKIVSLPSA